MHFANGLEKVVLRMYAAGDYLCVLSVAVGWLAVLR